ncbi:hypothetical protein V1277_006474 [Bradyrhizobium sp. AZCC 1588]|uniref:copper-binding protein n=1 Tax=Bradyrhizobium sp. AZCC 1588 TaxID=3117018 RepID=UPI003066AF7C
MTTEWHRHQRQCGDAEGDNRHVPVPALNWPPMKMEFATAQSVDLSKVKPGDKGTLKGSGDNYSRWRRPRNNAARLGKP